METKMQRYSANDSLSTISSNRVLRNTYWLLALSMIPTVLGAWIGVQFNLTLFANSPLIGFMAFLAIAFGFLRNRKNEKLRLGDFPTAGLYIFMGLMLSRLLAQILGFSNGASLIVMAFGGTAIVFSVMATVATVAKSDFSGLGKWLFAGLMVIIIAAVANIFLQLPALHLAISVLAIAIFSAYILFDVQQVINGGETNYISATLRIYLDLYNVFVNLLSLLGIFGGNRE